MIEENCGGPDLEEADPGALLERLLEGNRRFASGRPTHGQGIDPSRRTVVAGGQRPFAALLTCADSRVAPEHVFDVGLGELFVCRTAGNVVGEAVIGSFEFAVLHCDCRLLCVVGHSSCGAVTAAVEADGFAARAETPCVGGIVYALSHAVAPTRPDDLDREDWVEAAGRANVERMCDQLLRRSELLREAVETGRVGLAGLWYDLRSGRVERILAPAIASAG